MRKRAPLPGLSYPAEIDGSWTISDYPGPRQQILPDPEESSFAWARENPGKWRYFVDPTADKTALTERNTIGGWHADESGGIQPWLNPAFTPSSEYAQREIASFLDLAVWRVDYGFCELGHFIEVFSRSELNFALLDDDPEGRRGWPFDSYFAEHTGEKVLHVYTSAARLGPNVNPWLRRTVSGRVILEEVCTLERSVVTVDGDTAYGMQLQGAWLARWWRQWQDAERADLAAESERSESDG